MTDTDKTEWPVEIWMAEREEYDQGVLNVRTAQTEDACHRYVDADILESQERYYRHQIEHARAKALDEAAAVCAEWFGTPDADDIARVLHSGIIALKDECEVDR